MTIRVRERDAAKWLWIAILERDGVRRKCELMREIESVLDSNLELLIVDNTLTGRMIDRIGSLAQFYGYDNGNGRGWLDRQTDGINGMLSFNDGAIEQAKIEADFDLGLMFFDNIDYGYNNNDVVEEIVTKEVEDLSTVDVIDSTGSPMEKSKKRIDQLFTQLEQIISKYASE